MIRRLSEEIADFWQDNTGPPLLIGHGSGSFGHVLASQHATHDGAQTPRDWLGGAEVWWAVRRLNQIVVEALIEAGLPIAAFPPSACAISVKGEVREMATEAMGRALDGGWIPVVHGDVVQDRDQGLAIASTENVFAFLAREIRPNLVLLCGREPGVFADYPRTEILLKDLTPVTAQEAGIYGAEQTDVTGGMASKVTFAFQLTSLLPQVVVRVFSGETPGNLRRALAGEALGTRLHVDG